MAVIVPVFNRLQLLVETADSLRSQTLSDVEFILVDDGSDESVLGALARLSLSDPRFRVIRKPEGSPRGCQVSRNIGLDATAAEAVVFLDSDDLLAHECLEHRYSFLSLNPDADIVVGRQAGFSEPGSPSHWINIPATKPDLDRFLLLTQPLDVPWINGGVMIRTSALRDSGVRWRPEFHWDDVAFHFECLIAGLSARWMPLDGTPDSWYRRHQGERYGRALFSEDGMRSSAAMLEWMYDLLLAVGKATNVRRHALAVDFFHACVLRAIDQGHWNLASELIETARGGRVMTPRQLHGLKVYLEGRRFFAGAPRLTYYWNRAANRLFLGSFFSALDSTYSSIPAA